MAGKLIRAFLRPGCRRRYCVAGRVILATSFAAAPASFCVRVMGQCRSRDRKRSSGALLCADNHVGAFSQSSAVLLLRGKARNMEPLPLTQAIGLPSGS